MNIKDAHRIGILRQAMQILKTHPQFLPVAKAKPSRTSKGGILYFVQCNGERGPIKIGFSERSAHRRMSDFLTGNPYPIAVLAEIPGTREGEKRIHRQFNHLHIQGNWFEWGEELEKFILEMANGKPQSN